jgi:hypothetical protein
MAYIHTKFHLPSSTLSLFIANKHKAKGNIGTVGIFLIYILQKRCLRKAAYFIRSVTSFFGPKVRGVNVGPKSKFKRSPLCYFLIVENCRFWLWCSSNDMKIEHI